MKKKEGISGLNNTVFSQAFAIEILIDKEVRKLYQQIIKETEIIHSIRKDDICLCAFEQSHLRHMASIYTRQRLPAYKSAFLYLRDMGKYCLLQNPQGVVVTVDA